MASQASRIVVDAKRNVDALAEECEFLLDQNAEFESDLIGQKEKIEMLEAQLADHAADKDREIGEKNQEISQLKGMLLNELGEKNQEISELKRLYSDMQNSSSGGEGGQRY